MGHTEKLDQAGVWQKDADNSVFKLPFARIKYLFSDQFPDKRQLRIFPVPDYDHEIILTRACA